MPFARLFTKRDSRTIRDTSVEEALLRLTAFLRQSQFHIDFVSPTQVHAEQFYQKLGLRRVMDVWVSEAGPDAAVTVEFSATLGDAEAAVGVLGAALLFPVAVAVGAVSYLDYESDANMLMASLWSYLSTPTSPARRCGNCGLELDQESRFCKRCGAQAQS